MKCSRCKEKAVISSPVLCKKHFVGYFEKKIFDTIKKYNLINKSDKVVVACSGGKDSTNVLYLVKKFLGPKGKVTALLIDEGISGYRDKTVSDLKHFCAKHSISLKMVSFKKEFGSSLDEIIRSKKINAKPCTICGTLRRYLLNKYAKGFGVIVTGHNLDDESHAVLMNLLRQQLDVLARMGPVTGVSSHKGFVKRVKPLYFCSEKESMLYALLRGFDVSFNECPYVVESYRAEVRDILNGYESSHKGTKLNIIKSFLKLLPALKEEFKDLAPNACNVCGEPCAGNMCKTCNIVSVLNSE